MEKIKFKEEDLNSLQHIVTDNFNFPVFKKLLKELDLSTSQDGVNADFVSLVLRILTQANINEQISKLINALLSIQPDSEPLLKFAARAGMTARRSTSNLEALINSKKPQDLGKTLRTLHKLEKQVCSIELDTPKGEVQGTGFLVGPALVLTNYHVVEALINEEVTSEDVSIRFDYKTLEGGKQKKVIFEGTIHKLNKDEPVLTYSPYDKKLDPNHTSLKRRWPKNHLDFALLQLAKKAGEELPGPPTKVTGVPLMPRGWITFPETRFTLKPKDPLFIIQHPDGKPIHWDYKSEAVTDLDPNKQRVRYLVNTEKGSSGSPCFNDHWNLVALHHAGDPNHWNPGYNQGIPINNIAKFIEKEGLKQWLVPEDLHPIIIEPELPEVAIQNDPNLAFKSIFLYEEMPFIPRTPFNRAIKGMISGTGSRVLILTGQERTGLTYSYYFIQHAAECHGYRCFTLSLQSLFTEEGTAESLPLAQYLIQKMGIDYNFPAEEEFKLTGFCSTFSGKVALNKQKFLIFIDHLAFFPMTIECINFINKLAVTIQRELPNVRLVLAGFKETLSIDNVPTIKTVSMDSFSLNNLDDFFRGFYELLPHLAGKRPEESVDDFVKNSKEMIQEHVNMEEIPNVEEVGVYVKNYCDWLIEKFMDA